MTKLNSRSRLAAFALILLAAAPAQALVNRAWVSGHGADDAGCGAPTSPCRSFQYVHDNIIAAGGEIDVLDPAGYGAVRITKALSIVNDGVGTAGTQTSSPGQDGIDINTGPNDLVLLKGLTVDGVGTGGVGINLQSASRLVVIDCTIEGFGAADPYGVGIAIAPGTASGTARFTISNTKVVNNALAGIFVAPNFYASGASGASGTIKNLVASNNLIGVYATSVQSTNPIQLDIDGGAASENSQIGVLIGGYPTTPVVVVNAVNASGNGQYGIQAQGVVSISNSVATGNVISDISGTITSYKNNLYTTSSGTIAPASLR